ncbi:hypothetical protein Q8F55_007781 [Vanrija albida]|uniref:Enzyme activator n=1 Tax=Vanrija albida TaxID=181172 RepID=A0ABR3PVI2_9TREE
MPAAPPRRAHTYDAYLASEPLPSVDEYADGNGLDASNVNRSTSMRDFAEPLALPELDLSDNPLPPSYSAAMASPIDGRGASAAQAPHHPPAGGPTPRPTQAPYAPVDYQSQVGYDGIATGPDPNHRMSADSGASHGIPPRRPHSDANDVEADFANLRLTGAPQHPQGQQQFHGGQPGAPAGHGVQRQQTMPSFPSPYGGMAPQLRGQRSVTAGHHPAPGHQDPSASVYSLDSGLGAYGAAPKPGPGRGYGGPPPGPHPPGAGWPNQPFPNAPQQEFVANPYYNAANDFLGLPPAGGPPPAGQQMAHGPPSRQASMSNLARTNTSRSNMSTLSLSSMGSIPPPPRVTSQAAQQSESVGASSTRRRGAAAAIDVSKPPYTREFVDDYRNRMKVDPDPEAQFAFAKYLIEAAKKIGDEIGQHDSRAGRKYRDSLLAESLRNIKKLAESKDPYADAQFFLANLYGTGQLGLAVDHEKAYYLYLMASKLNHPAATYRAAVCCELGAGTKRDPGRSVLFYRKAAALGDTAAMYKLALILLNGIMNHPRNPREALVWLRRAAAQADEDNPHALHELALLHERPNNGTNGVIPFDPNLSREYLTQAGQLGYPPAQFKLGSCHEFGTLGFPIDPRRSIAWYTRAAEKGEAEAELALSGWYLTGSEGVLKQSDTEAYLWGRKAANKGLAKAEYAVGYYTEIGIGVKQDMELAKRWYMRAASQNHKRAMQRLAELNSNKNVKGKGARPTRKEAESECVIM